MSIAAAYEWRTRTALLVQAWNRRQSLPVRLVFAFAAGVPVLLAYQAAVDRDLQDAERDLGLLLFSCIGLLVYGWVQRRRGRPERAPASGLERALSELFAIAILVVPFVAAVRHSPWWLVTVPSCVFAAAFVVVAQPSGHAVPAGAGTPIRY